MEGALAERVALACIQRYTSLPQTGKPSAHEWTVLAGVVLLERDESGAPRLQVVALGTGTKCLPASVADADRSGLRTRDGHAEVSARRAFRRYLCAQLRALLEGRPSVLERAHTHALAGVDKAHVAPFRLRSNIELALYTSASPCGDASLCMQPRHSASVDGPPFVADSEAPGRDETLPSKRPRLVAGSAPDAAAVLLLPDDTPRLGPHSPGCGGEEGAARPGHAPGAAQASLSALEPQGELPAAQPGAVQRKPGRGEFTRSVSCSDKLARWSALGMHGALLSHLIAPVTLDWLVVGGPACPSALERATWSRAVRAASSPAWPCGQGFGPKQMRLLLLVSPIVAGARPDRAAGPACCEVCGGGDGLAHAREGSDVDGPTEEPAAAASQVPPAMRAAELERLSCCVLRPPAISACSHSINWSLERAPCASEAVNGQTGLKLGANQRKPSAKHGSRVSKGAILAEFVALCAMVPPASLPPALAQLGLPGSPGVTYRQLKEAAELYQRAKRCFLRADGPFAAWTSSPPHNEEFSLSAAPARSLELRAAATVTDFER